MAKTTLNTLGGAVRVPRLERCRCLRPTTIPCHTTDDLFFFRDRLKSLRCVMFPLLVLGVDAPCAVSPLSFRFTHFSCVTFLWPLNAVRAYFRLARWIPPEFKRRFIVDDVD